MRAIFGPTLMLSAPGRKEVAEKIDALMEEAKSRFGTPWWEDDLSDLDKPWDNGMSEVSLVLAPKWGQINAPFQRAIAEQDAGLLGIAMERYRLKFDSWPSSMADLEGEFLKTIPLDRVTGKPLLFKATKKWLTIYSVGGDLDDDGGNHDARTIPMNTSTFHTHKYDKSVDGDWVLWPVDRD